MPASWISFKYIWDSARMVLANSSGVLPSVSTPWENKRSLVCGDFTCLTTIALIQLTMSAGVPAGASTPYQELMS